MIWPSVEEERTRGGGWKRNGLILTIVFFCLTVFAVVMFAALFSIEIFVAAVCLALAEFLIQKRRFFGTGIESALWVSALVILIMKLPRTGSDEAILVFALAAAIVGLRMRSAFFGALAAILVVVYPGVNAVMTALALAIVCILALLVEWQRPSTEELFAYGVVAMPPAGYVVSLFRHSSNPSLQLAAAYAIYGAATLAFAIKRRDRATLIGSAIAIAIAAVEARDLIHATAEAKRILAGAALIAIGAAIARALRGKTNGFVNTPAAMTRYDEAMQLVAAASTAHHEPTHSAPERESGGGNFGGAGASGNY